MTLVIVGTSHSSDSTINGHVTIPVPDDLLREGINDQHYNRDQGSTGC